MTASDAFLRFKATRHFPNLDGLRFLAIVAVLWHHGRHLFPETVSAGPKILAYGFLGVDLFFVLSGFLITTLLLRETAGRGFVDIPDFLRRRALRIMPLYFSVVTVISLYYIVLRGRSEYMEALPFYYLFMPNFLREDIPLLSPTWSLGVEQQYYLLWPLLMVVVPNRRLAMVLGLLIAGNVAAASGLVPVAPVDVGPLLLRLPNATYAPILMGSMLAVLLDREESFHRLYRHLSHPMAASLLLLAIVLAVTILPDDLKGLPNFGVHLLMCGLMGAIVIRPDNLMAPFLQSRPARRIGEISYGIYLLHLIALHIAGMLGVMDRTLTFWLYVLLSVVLAEISFRTLEAYFLRLKTVRQPSAGAPPRSSGGI